MIENLQVEYQPGSDGEMGFFYVTADTPKGRYDLKRELPMELMSDDGLDYEETLGGVAVVDGPDFDPPYTEGIGAELYVERVEELVQEILEKWLTEYVPPVSG